MADFVVAFSNGKVIAYSGEGSEYFLDGDVLTVHDGKGQRVQFSPAGWLSVEDAQPVLTELPPNPLFPTSQKW